MLASTGEPGGDGGVSKAEDPLGSRGVQSFGQRRQHHRHVMGRGFQAIQGGVAPGSECGLTGLTAKRLDALGLTMLAIANQRMNGSVCDAKVRALLVGTGEAVGGYPLRGSPSAFHLSPGTYGQRCCPTAQRGSGGETTSGAIVWAAGLQQTVARGVLCLPS
ncbi:MAG TPA: hypothetical protein VIZ18_13095 [Ktedonobacteraceae bacterium]